MKRSGLCICFCLFCLTGCAKVDQVAMDLAKENQVYWLIRNTYSMRI